MADHSCATCTPYQDELERLTEPGLAGTSDTWMEVEDALFALDAVRAFICSDTAPVLPVRYRPGGEERQDFLDNRVVTKCKPCQPLADYLTTRSMTARRFRAAAQQERLDAQDGKYVDPESNTGLHAELQTRLVAVVEKLLAECKKIKCPPTDLERASESVLAVVDGYTPPPAPTTDPEPGDKSTGDGGPGKLTPIRMVVLGTILLAAAGTGWAVTGGSSNGTTTTTLETTVATDSPSASTAEAPNFADSEAAKAAIDAALGFGAEPDSTLACIDNGLALRNTTDAEIGAMENPDVSAWPTGLAERYAQVLEGCVPLRPYYLGWFGQYEFTDASCVAVMTDHVLANYSWLRFLEEGILDPDLRQQLQSDFDVFVNVGYSEKGCFAA